MSNVIELHPRVLTPSQVKACAGDVRRSLIAIETAQDGLRAALESGVLEALSTESEPLHTWAATVVEYLAGVEAFQGGALAFLEKTERMLAAAERSGA